MAKIKFEVETKDFKVSRKYSYRTSHEVYTRLKLSKNVAVSLVVNNKDEYWNSIALNKEGKRRVFFQVFIDSDMVSGDLEFCYSWKEVLEQMRNGYELY